MSVRKSSVDIDMFAFLSVLCSMIGVLMLFMLMIISTRVLAADEQPQPAPALAPPPLPDEPPKLEAGISEQEFQSYSRQVQQLAATLAERQRELHSLKRLVIELEDLIASKEDEALAKITGGGMLSGMQLEKPDEVDMVRVHDSAVTKRPIFVEVKAEGYVVHPAGRLYPVEQLDEQGSALQQFLAAAHKAAAKEYLLFLIHPNGVHAYDKIFQYLLKTYPHRDKEKAEFSSIDIGAEPFSRSWLLVREKLETR
jgi:hypothetical protein